MSEGKRHSILCLGNVGFPESNNVPAPPREVFDSRVALNALFQLSAPNSVGIRALQTAVEPPPSRDPQFVVATSLSPSLIGGMPAKICCGSRHGIMLLFNGEVVAISSDRDEHGSHISFPSETNILDIAAGDTHFVCCDDRGSVYTWGWSNEYGQLGDATLWKVVPRYAGEKMVLTEPKRLASFGDDPNEVSHTSKMVKLGKRTLTLIIAVAAGRHHSVLLDVSKTRVFTFGRGHRGQLCQGPKPVDLSPVPRCVKSIFGCSVTQICAAPDGDHTLILLETGKLLGFGDNSCSTLGTGENRCAFEPQTASFTDVEGDSWQQELIAIQKEKVSTSIKAPYDSIESFLYPRRIHRLPPELPSRFPMIAAVWSSASHTLALTGDGALYSSGLRPIRVNPSHSVHVDAVGPLGRRIVAKANAKQFGPMDLPSDANAAVPACGEGFSAMIANGGRKIYLYGSIATKSGTILEGSGLKSNNLKFGPSNAARPCTLDLNPNERAISVFACRAGLVVVVEISS